MLSGRLTTHRADQDESLNVGDACTNAPGHTPELFAGTVIAEFSAR